MERCPLKLPCQTTPAHRLSFRWSFGSRSSSQYSFSSSSCTWLTCAHPGYRVLTIVGLIVSLKSHIMFSNSSPDACLQILGLLLDWGVGPTNS